MLQVLSEWKKKIIIEETPGNAEIAGIDKYPRETLFMASEGVMILWHAMAQLSGDELSIDDTL